MIDAPADAIFEVLARPARHVELDGSGTLRGAVRGPDRLTPGARFSMAMAQSKARYRSLNRVVEFDDGRALTWETVGLYRRRRFIGGQRWRFALVPLAEQDGHPSTLVLHSYDWGAALGAPALGLLGYPRRSAAAMTGTLQRLADTVSQE